MWLCGMLVLLRSTIVRKLKIEDQYLCCEDQNIQDFIQDPIQYSIVAVYLSIYISGNVGKCCYTCLFTYLLI
jgi:hypothetical protein